MLVIITKNSNKSAYLNHLNRPELCYQIVRRPLHLMIGPINHLQVRCLQLVFVAEPVMMLLLVV